MRDAGRYFGQAIFYVLICAFIGYFSVMPVYHQVPAGLAQIKLSFRHGGQRIDDCRKLTSEEIAKLPANERRPNTCLRERLPLTVELLIDDQPLYSAVLEPTGLSRDGPSETYQKFLVTAGQHKLQARLRDSKRQTGFDYEKSVDIALAPYQNLAIDFKADLGGFILK